MGHYVFAFPGEKKKAHNLIFKEQKVEKIL